MIKIKYFEKFKNDFPFLVVLSNKKGLKDAYNFFKGKNGAFLNDRNIAEFSDISPLENDNLFLTSRECQEIAQHFKSLYDFNQPSHIYFDVDALGEEIEVIISYGEYDNLF